MGGHVVTAAAQSAPQLIERLVYVCAFMPASGAAGGAYVQSSENEGELVGPLVVADPGVVGAIRLDTRTPDPGYRAGLRDAFYGDISADAADGAIRLLSTDLPLGIAGGATRSERRGVGLDPAHLRAVLRRPRDPSGAADALHRRGRRGLPREHDPRRRSRHRALPVHVGARSPRGCDPGGVIGMQSLGRVGIWSRELRFGDAAEARDASAELEELGYGTLWIPGRWRWGPARGRRRSARRDASGGDRDGDPQRVRARSRGRRARPRRDRRVAPRALPPGDRHRACQVPGRGAGRALATPAPADLGVHRRSRALRAAGHDAGALHLGARARRWSRCRASEPSASTRTWCPSSTPPGSGRRSARARSWRPS